MFYLIIFLPKAKLSQFIKKKAKRKHLHMSILGWKGRVCPTFKFFCDATIKVRVYINMVEANGVMEALGARFIQAGRLNPFRVTPKICYHQVFTTTINKL
jgi:hypothetical protein